VTSNLAAVKAQIEKAEKAAGRAPGSVTLVAVSKTHDAARVREVIEAGQRIFGENRVQEAAAKWPALKQEFPDIELHLIGPLQTNKLREAVAVFDVIETVDRPKLAEALARAFEQAGRSLPCYIQINTGEEPQKAGIPPREADAFIRLCRDELKLPVAGLMCIPPAEEEPALHFALLHKIAARNGIRLLSMGMSSDFRVAIQFGATHVRVGTAIFGARPVVVE
jgi:pyridoxal phosphate enzyme (YggS family)